MLTADRDVSMTGSLPEAKAVKIRQASTIMTPSIHTPMYDLIKASPAKLVSSPANAASGMGPVR